MKLNKISNSEFSQNLISSLPIRPNVSSRYGKAAMSGDELKEMFDKNSELLRARINAIIDYISGQGENGIASEIVTGVPELPTLKSMFEGILDGSFAATLTLTEEYTLLDFATKLMNFVLPESSIEFIKVEKENDVYALPSRPYENHEHAIYLLPSTDTLSLFDCYIWEQDHWSIWSTGSLQSYVKTLDEIVNVLWNDCARISDISYLKTVKADEADVLAMSAKIDAMCSGTPIPYTGTLEMLENDLSKKRDAIYIITNTSCPHYGCWCYHDGSVWRVGGKYGSDTATATMIQKYDPSPVSSGAVKCYIDEALADALDGIGRDYSGDVNIFDKYAITQGIVDRNGNVVYDADFIVTDYLDVAICDSIYCSRLANIASRQDFCPSGYLLYTYDETPISETYTFNRSTFLSACINLNKKAYPDADKMRLIFKKAYYESSSKIMVNEGTSWRKYAPYRKYVYDIDGIMSKTSTSPVQNKTIYEFVEQKLASVKWQFGSKAVYPTFDTKQNKLIFNRDAQDEEWGIMLDGVMYRFLGGVTAEIDISPAATHDAKGKESNKGVVYLNTQMLRQYTPSEPSALSACFSVRDADFTHTDKYALPIATYRRNGDDFCAWMDCPFYIDGSLFGVCVDGTAMQSKIEGMEDNVNMLISSQQQLDISMSEVLEKVNEFQDVAPTVSASVEAISSTVDALDTRVGGLELSISDASSNAESALSQADYALQVASDNGFYNNFSTSNVFISNKDGSLELRKLSTNASGNPFVEISFEEELYNSNRGFRHTVLIPALQKPVVLSFYSPYYDIIEPFFTGDDCTGGVFTPQANTEYTMFMWRVVDLRCHIIATR